VVNQAPSGAWHRDPVGHHEYRYWDGIEWTSHVADNGVAAVDPLLDSLPAPPPRPTTKEEKEQQAIAAREAYESFPDLPGTHAEWRRTEGDRWSLDLVERNGDILARDRHRGYTRKITVGEHAFAERHQGRRLFTSRLREVIDLETGAPIFRIEGSHSYHSAKMSVHFPDGREYSFPVQGAVMTALDETGSAVAKFRIVYVPSPRLGKWNSHPKDEVVLLVGDELVTRELMCVIAVARLQLHLYISKPGGGA
jgi:hypothetical protein